MEKPIIRTYSRKQPVTVFKSAATLVPTYPSSTNATEIRESQLHDKTLLVDVFEDTFDRLATGVIIQSPNKSSNHTSNHEDSDDLLKITLQDNSKKRILRRNYKNENNEKLKNNNKIYDKKKPKENKKKVISNKKTGLKRKIYNYECNDDNFESTSYLSENKDSIKIIKSQEPVKKIRKVKNKMKRTSPVRKKKIHLNKCTVLIEKCNADVNLSKSGVNNNKNNKIKKSLDLIKEYNDFLNPNHLKDKEHLLTSTPRVHKLRMSINMQNLSPITLDEDNNEYQQTTSPLLIQHEKQKCKENVLQSSLNHNNILPTFEFVKPQENELKSVHSNITNCTSANNIKEFSNHINNKIPILHENNVDNNLNISKLLSSNGLHNLVNNVNICERNLLEQISVAQSHVERQSLNVTPIMKDKVNQNIVSFIESPLLFDEIQYNQNQSCKKKSIILNDISDNFKNLTLESNKNPIENSEKYKNILDFNTELVNNENKNCDSLKSDSLFSLHDWSNDYNSSYEYLTDSLRMKQKRSTDFENDENFQKNLTDHYNTFNNLNAENELSIESEKDFVLQENDNREIKQTEKIVNLNNILDSTNEENIVPNSNEIDTKNINLDEKEKTDDNIKLDLGKTLRKEDLYENSNNQKSPVISLRNLRKKKIKKFKITKLKEKIKEHLNKNNGLNILEENIINTENKQENINTDFQDNKICTTPSCENMNSENKIKLNDSIREGSNVHELMLQIPNDENLDKQSRNFMMDTYTNTFNEKENGTDNDDKNYKIMKENICNIISTDRIYQQNENINSKLNYHKLVVSISKLDQNVENQSPILSKKILKKTIKKSAVQKKNNNNIKTRNQKMFRINEVDTVDVKNFKTGQDKTYLNKIEEVESLESTSIILTAEEKSTKKEQFKKTKNVRSISKDKSLIEKDKIIETKVYNVKNPGADIMINKNNSISPRQDVQKENMEVNFEKDEKINIPTNHELTFHSKLNDPVKITMKRNTFKNWNKPLAIITENQIEDHFNTIKKDNNNDEKVITSEKESINVHKDIKEITPLKEDQINKSIDDNCRSLSVILKPGKSWARSLSIINNLHNVKNLDKLAIGRGKNWRHSVQTILNMQPEGIVQNIMKNKDEENDSLSHSFAIPETNKKEKNGFNTAINSPRFSRRFSIRIVPSGKRSTLTDDFIDIQRNSYISSRTRKTSIARQTLLKFQNDNLIETEDDLIRSAKNIILKRCNQTSYLQFNVCFPDSYINCCRKIGEGVYGEVFLYENNNEQSVIKIIPIEGEELINCEPQKKFHEILSEIIISQELHKLRFGDEYNTDGFVKVNRIRCIIGSYPDKLIELWNKYDQEKKSENDCPSIFNNQQLFIVLELAHGGQDLEAFVFQNASACYSIFIQAAFSLAIAEKSFEFEHRDLHWGNLLISETNDAYSIFKLDNTKIVIPTKGVKVAVIDFTLSRMSYQGCKIFNDLATDPTLFTAQGEYQFDIYRMMKDNVDNDWQQFKPYTNVLWLDYILDKMITAVRYKKKITKIHKTAIQQMKELRKDVLNYDSAYNFVKNCEQIKAMAKINNDLT